MSLVALITLSFGAAIGLMMAVNHFRGEKSGMATGIVHGLFTVSGVVIFATALVVTKAETGWTVMWLLLGTAAGGAYLFSRQIRGLPWPKPVILAHGGAAILSIVLLGMLVFGPDQSGDRRTQRSSTGTQPATTGADAPGGQPDTPPPGPSAPGNLPAPQGSPPTTLP